MTKRKKILFGGIGVLLACALVLTGFGLGRWSATRVSGNARGKPQGWYWSDTTQDMELWVGDTYTFAITVRNVPVTDRNPVGFPVGPEYFIGNGKILETYEISPSWHTNRRDSTTTYDCSFRCLAAGETGVYLQPSKGKKTRLFKVKVNPTVSAGSLFGTDASKFSKVEIVPSYQKEDKIITDQRQITELLRTVAPVQLRHIKKEQSNRRDYVYSVRFYPIDGSAASYYIDGKCGQYGRVKDGTLDDSLGYYPLLQKSTSLWNSTIKQFYEHAPGTVRDRFAND